MPIPSTQPADPTRAIPFLDGMNDESRATLASYLTENRVSAGQTLLAQGQPNDRLWFLVTGTVQIERTISGGKPEVLASLPAPSVFGTTTFFRPTTPASATLRAESELHLWTLDRASQERIRREDPRTAEALATAIIIILSERFDLLDRRLTGLMAEHAANPSAVRRPAASELAAFRTRLFEEPGL